MDNSGLFKIIKKAWFMCLPTQKMRTNFVKKHSNEFRKMGEVIFFQSRYYPADPELISIGNNVFVTADVRFINHDTIRNMLNWKYRNIRFPKSRGCIEIGDNVMIGSGTVIMQDVRIGSNVIIGAGSIVTKDIPDNSVAAGIPCKVIGDFEKFVAKRKNIKEFNTSDEYWQDFENKRK